MMIVCLGVLVSYLDSPNKGSDKFGNMGIKPKDLCVDSESKPIVHTDLPGCPQAYVDLHKLLPSTTAITTELAAYTTACSATRCAEADGAFLCFFRDKS
jgi:hypothetical protein